MASNFYLVCFLLTLGVMIHVSQKKYKNTNRYLWTILVLIPIVVLGYWLKSTVHSAEAAMVAFCFIYLDSTVLPVVLLFSLVKSMRWELNPSVKLTAYSVTALHLLSIWLSHDTKLYYESITVEETSFGTITKMVSGPLKFTHYIFLILITLAFTLVFVKGILRKGNGSRKNLAIYLLFAASILVIYVVEMLVDISFSTLPGMYTLGAFVIAANYEHVQSHDIFNLIGEKQSKTGLRGFCAFDMKRCLLGYNKQFADMIPEIDKVVVDEAIPKQYEEALSYLNHAMDVFDTKRKYSEKVELPDKTIQLIVSEFSVSRNDRQNGYLLEISDITEEQKKIDTIEKYSQRLSDEVSRKTEDILAIQNSVVLGLANMVENRDDNTGGHVKRTSDVIKLLVQEIQRQGIYKLEEQQAKDIVRAAPMHDLGKISIDSAILCKPGRLDPDEYSIMKTHAPKSGEIVKIILEGVEEQHFVEVSFHVARFHHERWDGKGYPDGLMGEEIPVEARIMAVADVYDALVSKRCYKEPFSFEEAFKIMIENMGSQFDPAMRPVFVTCRERLENYYRQHS